MKVIARPIGVSVGDWLLKHFADIRWNSFQACVAYVKRSGTRHLVPHLQSFLQRPGVSCQIAVGISSQGSSLEGVSDLNEAIGEKGDLVIVHEGKGGRGSFHPKGYLFSNQRQAAAVIGSANLTEGGLYANHELSLAVTFDLTDTAESETFSELEQVFNSWLTPSAWCRLVSPALLTELSETGHLPSELEMRQARAENPKGEPSGFGHSDVVDVPPHGCQPDSRGGKRFVIEVRPHHNGEVFLSYNAVREDPDFFGYPFTGRTTPKRAGNRPYPQYSPDPPVEIIVYGDNHEVLDRKPHHPLNVVDYEPKREIRITIPDGLHHRIPQMSVLVMTERPSEHLSYRLEFHPPGGVPAEIERLLTNTLPSGGAPVARRYGWTSANY